MYMREIAQIHYFCAIFAASISVFITLNPVRYCINIQYTEMVYFYS